MIAAGAALSVATLSLCAPLRIGLEPTSQRNNGNILRHVELIPSDSGLETRLERPVALAKRAEDEDTSELSPSPDLYLKARAEDEDTSELSPSPDLYLKARAEDEDTSELSPSPDLYLKARAEDEDTSELSPSPDLYLKARASELPPDRYL